MKFSPVFRHSDFHWFVLFVFIILSTDCVATPIAEQPAAPEKTITASPTVEIVEAIGPLALKKPIDLRNLLRHNKLAELETLYRYLASEPRPRTPDGQLLLLIMFNSLLTQTDQFPGYSIYFQRVIPIVEEWVASKPDSHLAHALLGSFRIQQAWAARGSGWASTVAASGWQEFQKRLIEARVLLNKAWELDPSDPYPPIQLITVAMGLQEDLEEINRLVDMALKADPDDIMAFENKLYYLEPKWHGSIEQMLEFARECAKSASPSSSAPYILLNAHRKCANYTRKLGYFKMPGVWEELKLALETLVERFPRSYIFRNEYAYTAFRAGDYYIAYRELGRLGPKWYHQSLWQSLGDYWRIRDSARRMVDLEIQKKIEASIPEDFGYATETFMLPIRCFPESTPESGF